MNLINLSICCFWVILRLGTSELFNGALASVAYIFIDFFQETDFFLKKQKIIENL